MQIILGSRFFPLSTLTISYHSLLVHKSSTEKSADILMGVPFFMKLCFSLNAFRIYCWTFAILIMIYIGKGLCSSFYLWPSMLPNLNTCSLLQVWELWTHNFTKYIFDHQVSVFFWDPYNANIALLDIIPKSLKQFSFLFPLCAVLIGGFHYSNFQITCAGPLYHLLCCSFLLVCFTF